MPAPKLTPWISASTPPVRRGVYIASCGRNRFYRYWNGKQWLNGSYGLRDVRKDAKPYRGEVAWWRGLAVKP